jgi:DNA-binding NarL/FixJ family response regulator
LPGGTLIVSRNEKLFPYYIKRLEAVGFEGVTATGEEKDSLDMVIRAERPRLVLLGSGFYHAGTPYMAGQLLKRFPKLSLAAVSLAEFPDSLAVWFIWRGAKSYVNLLEGLEEFYAGLEAIRQGKPYIAPGARRLMDEFPEWPRTPDALTKRRLEVLIMICNGFIPERIGDSLHVSRATVNYHLQELYNTFHVKSREELIKTAFGLRLVTDKDLVFNDRKKGLGPLPEWAERKLKMERRH